MDTTALSDETAVRTLHVSEAIPEMDEEKAARNDTKNVDDESWRHSLSQLPPSAFHQPSYAGPNFYREWKPKCNHYTMTRLYHPKDRCENCGKLGGSGWLYRCTVDREPLIIQNKEEGLPYAFDELGLTFAETMTLGKRGPQVRTEKLSFLKELTKEELATYSPEQLVIISQQRDNVAAKIEETRILSKERYAYRDKPWVPSREQECQFKVCHACHHFGMEKSFVSLNAILNDEVPPTVATAYGFSLLRFRQMSHANIVKNAGYRAVTIKQPRFHPARSFFSPNSIQAKFRRIQAEKEAAGEVDEWAMHRENFPPRGSLTRSNKFPDLQFCPPFVADRSVRNAVNCLTTGTIRTRQLSDNDDDDAAAARLAIKKRCLEASSRRNVHVVKTVNTFDDDHPFRKIGDKSNAARATDGKGTDNGSGSQSSALLEPGAIGGEPESADSTLLADISECSEGSSGTWETLSAGTGVALTEEAAELGAPDLVAL